MSPTSRISAILPHILPRSEPTGDRYARLAVGALALLSLAALVITILTTFAAGVTWDDGIELRGFRDELALLHNGAPDYATAAAGIVNQQAYYGIVADGLAHLVAWSLGIEPAEDIAVTPSAYAARHFVTLGFGILCVFALAWTLWRLTHKPAAAVALPALLLGLPTFGGHAAMNIKDVPVACGLTLVGCGCALMLRGLQVGGERTIAVPLIAAGTFIAVGTRGGSVALVAVVVGISGIAAALCFRRRSVAAFQSGGAAILASIACVLATNPVAWYAPFRWLFDCVRVAAAYPSYNIPQFVIGRLVPSQPAPWWYVPVWLAVQTPLAFAALVAAGVSSRRQNFLVALPFVALGLIIPVLIILAGSTLYNAARHLLFALPVLALAAALGTDRIAARRPWLAVGLVAMVVAECALWMPYQYAYLNQIGIALGGAKAFEGDYWGIGGREAARRLRAAGAERIIVGPGPTGLPYGGGTQSGDVPVFDGYYAFSFGGQIALAGYPIPPASCRRQFVIARMGMLLGEGFICTPPATLGPLTQKK